MRGGDACISIVLDRRTRAGLSIIFENLGQIPCLCYLYDVEGGLRRERVEGNEMEGEREGSERKRGQNE
jgi:hypothetical protein